ncbi:MAG: hypothetical protein WCG47_32290, partial [Dermatophilaceae bacterium]
MITARSPSSCPHHDGRDHQYGHNRGQVADHVLTVGQEGGRVVLGHRAGQRQPGSPHHPNNRDGALIAYGAAPSGSVALSRDEGQGSLGGQSVFDALVNEEAAAGYGEGHAARP